MDTLHPAIHKASQTLGLAFILGFLICGLTIFPLSYSALNRATETLSTWWMIGCFLSGIASHFVDRFPTARTAFMVSAGLLTAVVIRIFFDTMADPTNHNLWPLELAYDFVISFLPALFGAFLARLIVRSTARSISPPRRNPPLPPVFS